MKLKRKIIATLLVSLTSLFLPLTAIPATAATTPMIVGGHDATHQYGAVSIWLSGRNRCAGTLISPSWVVTAAHCSPILVPGQTQIRASSLDNTNNFEAVGLAAVYINPNFNSDTFDNDIALIKLQSPVKNSLPVPISPISPRVNSTGVIAGWGWICQDSTNPSCGKSVNILQELNVKVVPAPTCSVWDVNPAHQSCLVASDGSDSMACYGDSGGPFVQKFFNTWVLMGVTSGDGVDSTCATDPTPNGGTTQGSGVWTNVAPYVPWILNTIISNAGSTSASQIPTVIS